MRVLKDLKAADPSVELRRVEFVGPQVGQELVHNGLMALLVVVLGIVVCLGIRFEWKFALRRRAWPTCTTWSSSWASSPSSSGNSRCRSWPACWPVLGYSVNESVVIMDRIRENFRKVRARHRCAEVINGAITQTHLAHHHHRTVRRR